MVTQGAFVSTKDTVENKICFFSFCIFTCKNTGVYEKVLSD